MNESLGCAGRAIKKKHSERLPMPTGRCEDSTLCSTGKAADVRTTAHPFNTLCAFVSLWCTYLNGTR